ncbi:tetratricopeptide repeat protein [candidate division CSSED10-310 bacterium]|uniref:Tetratricopeptide repeat protein n=1 Tax=candidate division CSSED10-310 bacterium TaxID=2855610 RepID=A0ABV6YUM2_UNCC1
MKDITLFRFRNRSFKINPSVARKVVLTPNFFAVSLLLVCVGFCLLCPGSAIAAENRKVTKKMLKVEKYFSKNETEQALNLLEALIKKYPDDPRPYVKLARYYLKAKLYNDAIRYAEDAYKVDPDSKDVKEVLCDSNQGIGQMNITLRKFNFAMDAYNKMYKLCPTEENKKRMAFLYSKIVQDALQRKDYDVAIQNYEKILELQPENQPLYFELVRLYLKNNQEDKAFSILQRGVAAFPEDIKLLNALGSLYFRKEKYEEAKGLYQRALERDPQNIDIAKFYAYTEQSIAHKKFNTLREEDKLPKTTLTPGKTKSSQKKYKEDVEVKKQEMITLKQDIYQPVIDAFKKAIELDTANKSPKLSMNLAVIYGFIGLDQEMTRCYVQTGEIYKSIADANPEDIDALHYYGFCMHSAGNKIEEAEAAFRKVIESDTENKHPTAANYLGEILVEKKEYEEAKSIFEKFIESYPSHPARKRAAQWLDYIEAILKGDAGKKPMKFDVSEPVIDLGADESEGLTLDEGGLSEDAILDESETSETPTESGNP